MDANIRDFSCFFEKGENARNCLFYNRKQGSGHLKIDEKSIQNPSKIYTKKNIQKVLKMRPTWSQNENQNGSEIRLWRFGAGFWGAWNLMKFPSSKIEAKIWKKTEIWSPEGSDELFLGGAGLRLWSSAKISTSQFYTLCPRAGGGFIEGGQRPVTAAPPILVPGGLGPCWYGGAGVCGDGV